MDWLKHAFITRFNDIPADAYKDYTVLLASDLILCKQKYVSHGSAKLFLNNGNMCQYAIQFYLKKKKHYWVYFEGSTFN